MCGNFGLPKLGCWAFGVSATKSFPEQSSSAPQRSNPARCRPKSCCNYLAAFARAAFSAFSCVLFARTGRRLLSVFSMLNQNGAPKLNSAALAATPQKCNQLGVQKLEIDSGYGSGM